MKRVFVQSFGCRASQADGAAIEAAFADSSFEPVRDPGAADLVILNTCTVTASADVETRRVIRGIHRDYPEAQILVTGCYAQRGPDELAQLPGVRWVVGNTHKTEIAQIVSRSTASRSTEDYHGQIVRGDISQQTAFAATPVRGVREDRTRPNLKIQDGCGNRCSFCIIPSVRGPSRSAAARSVIEQVQDLSREYGEIVLSGINLGRWGRDLPGEKCLVDLLRTLLRETAVPRLRISSIEPMDWSGELLEAIAGEPRLAKHVHLPLQSGSDSVLKRMFRRYRTRHYASRVALARSLMPDAAIGADVMTGFPDETDREFSETVDFITAQPFTYLHVFTYSERPGTYAAEHGRAVPVAIRHERTRILRDLSVRKNIEFRRGMPGKVLSAIALERPGAALSSNFLNVELAHERRPNQIFDVTIGGVNEAGLREETPFRIV